MSKPTPRREEFEPAFLHRSRHSEELGVKLTAKGPVSYLDAESLRQPLELPHKEYRRLYLIVAFAVVIGIALFGVQVVQGFIADRDASALVEQTLAEAGEIELPNLQELAGKSNDDIREALADAGYSLYDNTSDEDREADGFDLIGVPSSMTDTEVSLAYSNGLSNLSSADAAKLFTQSWRLLANRANGNELRLRYVDFSSPDAVKAIESALSKQGLKRPSDTAASTDNMGNTNLSGTFTVEDTEYAYTVSTCDLNAVYDIDGLPSDAQYVGIKVNW